MIVFIMLLALFLVISLIFLKDVLSFIDSRSSYLRSFTRNNSGFFTIFFLFIFFIEQLLLMLITYFFSDISEEGQLLVGIFALIVLSTAGLEKFILEKKNQYLSKEINDIIHENEIMLMKMQADKKKLFKAYVEVKEKLNKKP